MIDHIGFPVSDYARAKAFYLKALAPLGYGLVMEVTQEQTGHDPAAGFGADKFNFVIRHKSAEQTNGIAAAADTGYGIIRNAADFIHALLPRFITNDGLKKPCHHRERMRASHSAQNIMGIFTRGDPIAQRLINRIFQRFAAAGDGNDFCA